MYPDGTWCLKLGANSTLDRHFAVDDDSSSHVAMTALAEWFAPLPAGTSQVQHEESALRKVLQDLFPHLRVHKFRTKRCVITRTVDGRPLLARLGGVAHDHHQQQSGLFVATGGNGYGAMASDAVGRRAADMVLGV